jgi:hypothetical protein
MSESRKTLILAGVAVFLVAVALLTAPRKLTPDAFVDQGEPFFPEFTDPNSARTLEVIDFNAETGSAAPFKVTFKDGRWSIPSHYDHPADGKDRLAKTAAGVIGVNKDDFRSDNAADHELCGVVDPLDQATTSMTGRGQRVTMKGENDVVLADVILGKKIEGREGFRFVRVPDQKRIYAARADLDISTQFKDWIESDLLLVDKDAIDHVVLKDYSVNERSGQINERDVLTLRKDGDTWTANRMKADQEVDAAKVGQMLTALDELTIEGVRPKPPGLSVSLERSSALEISRANMLELQSKGYYFTRPEGRLVSNEGELEVRTRDGVTYTLRFGEIVYGSGMAVSAGTGAEPGGPGENRYLFITTRFDPSLFTEPAKPKNTYFLNRPDSLWTDDDRHNRQLQSAHDDWETRQAERRKTSDTLNARFANWYYVISSQSFDKLHQTRSDLVREKKS